jgi:peroxiredoxin
MLGRITRSVRMALLPSAFVLAVATPAFAQKQGQPSVQDMLALRPMQRFVEYDIPTPEQVATLKAELVTEGKAKIWVLRDSSNRTYRRFVDSDRDGVVDQWVYYRDGIEVYRDIDSNSNRLADQFRWLNSGGTRWGIDSNEDGRIDGYRIISVPEATREVMRAIALKEFGVLESVLARPTDAALMNRFMTQDQLKETASKARDAFTALTIQLSHFSTESQWQRIELPIPMLVAGEAPDGSRDIDVYRNVQVVVQTGGRTDVLEFESIVLVGRAAKIVELPKVVTPRAPTVAQTKTVFNGVPVDAPSTEPAVDGADKEQQELLVQLQKLDEESVRNSKNEAATVRYHLQRAEVLDKLADRSKTDDDRTEWMKQEADSLIAAVQTSGAKEPQERIGRFQERVRSRDGKSPLASYVAFRMISADYFRKMQASGSDFAAIQKDWLEELDKFVTDYPESEDAPEALSQLAIGVEFTGKEDAAREYYQKIVDGFPKSAPAPRARGALQRLGLVGKPFEFRASDLRRGTIDIEKYSGKVVLIDYWSTACDPWKSDLAKQKDLYNKYRSKGFEIIGVSLDNDKTEVVKFVQSNSIPWPVAFENGGLESAPALQYGILALPTQFLVDAKGQVVSRTMHISQLEEELKKLLPSK